MEEDHNDQATKQPNDHHDHDQHQHRQRVPFARRQLRSDSLLDVASIEQERAFSTLETIESEGESDSESNGGTAESSYNYDQEDYEFFEATRFEADLGFLDQYEDDDEDEDDMDEDEDEDELDVDELTYEELIALGEFIGVEKRGLSSNEISSCLHPMVWKTTSSVNPHHVDRCVVCQVEYEDGEKLVGLPNCEHPYHTECISKWLQLKKSCPICSTEVISSPPSNNNNAK